MVLIGEEARNLKSGEPPKFYGLVESEHRGNDAMLSKCAELSSITEAWYSNAIPAAERAALHQFNLRQGKKRQAGVLLFNVPMLSDAGDATQLFRYADAELDQGTRGGQKTVFLGDCPRVQSSLQNVPAGWDFAEDILKLPGVAALYYVLGAMFRLPYSAPSKEPGQAKIDYDVFNPPWEKKRED